MIKGAIAPARMAAPAAKTATSIDSVSAANTTKEASVHKTKSSSGQALRGYGGS